MGHEPRLGYNWVGCRFASRHKESVRESEEGGLWRTRRKDGKEFVVDGCFGAGKDAMVHDGN